MKEAKSIIEKADKYLKTQFETKGCPKGIIKKPHSTTLVYKDAGKAILLLRQYGLETFIQESPVAVKVVQEELAEMPEILSEFNQLVDKKVSYTYVVNEEENKENTETLNYEF
jgi:hypothetical protein